MCCSGLSGGQEAEFNKQKEEAGEVCVCVCVSCTLVMIRGMDADAVDSNGPSQEYEGPALEELDDDFQAS